MLKQIRKPTFKAGMYLLETLTAGMYNDPLSIYREYIQNAVDSIDIGKNQSKEEVPTIYIDLDPVKRNINIRDNGAGIPANIAESILSSIGSSNKQGSGLGEFRGFRGIGRLGGIAFSEKVIFRTKAEGERTESIQIWDCQMLKQIFNKEKYNLTLRDLFSQITSFSQHNSLPSEGSYFEVNLHGVSSFRNHIIDITKIRNYISQVAPVPFNYDQFPHGRSIDKYLKDNLTNYSAYNIVLNGKPIYKQYSKVIKTSMKKGEAIDNIDDIHFFDIKPNEKNPVAYGWYGKRKNLIGSIRKGEGYSGIRVRVGNILLGDAHLLDRCFREDRFNGYMIGEIHVNNSQLVPNSRRDDFIDNETKTLFYNAIEKKVGLPISKAIRLMSRIKTDAINLEKQPSLKEKSGCNSNSENVKEKLNSGNVKGKPSSLNVFQQQDILTRIKVICGNCPQCHSVSNIIEGIGS